MESVNLYGNEYNETRGFLTNKKKEKNLSNKSSADISHPDPEFLKYLRQKYPDTKEELNYIRSNSLEKKHKSQFVKLLPQKPINTCFCGKSFTNFFFLMCHKKRSKCASYKENKTFTIESKHKEESTHNKQQMNNIYTEKKFNCFTNINNDDTHMKTQPKKIYLNQDQILFTLEKLTQENKDNKTKKNLKRKLNEDNNVECFHKKIKYEHLNTNVKIKTIKQKNKCSQCSYETDKTFNLTR